MVCVVRFSCFGTGSRSVVGPDETVESVLLVRYCLRLLMLPFSIMEDLGDLCLVLSALEILCKE